VDCFFAAGVPASDLKCSETNEGDQCFDRGSGRRRFRMCVLCRFVLGSRVSDTFGYFSRDSEIIDR